MIRSIYDILTGPEWGPQNCKHAQTPRDEYLRTPRLNASAIKAGLSGRTVDVNLIRAEFEKPDEDVTPSQRDTLDKGTATHLYLLEPHRVERDIVVWTGGIRNGNQWREFNQVNRGKLILRQGDMDEVKEACRHALEIPEVARHLQHCRHEVALYWTELGDIRCKAQVDALRVTRGLYEIIDLKTSDRPVDQDTVLRTIHNLRYREQMAWYARAMRAVFPDCEEVRASCVFIRTQPPWGANIVRYGSDVLEEFGGRMERALQAIAETVRTIPPDKEWPVFFEETNVNLKPWEDTCDDGPTEAVQL